MQTVMIRAAGGQLPGGSLPPMTHMGAAAWMVGRLVPKAQVLAVSGMRVSHHPRMRRVKGCLPSPSPNSEASIWFM